MPNHVLNELVFEELTPSASYDLLTAALNEDELIDFEKLLPLPIHFWPGSVGIQHENTFPGTHLGAAREIWGTKWNAYGQKDEQYKPVVSEGGRVVLTFQTAWSPPYGWLMALFNTLRPRFTHTWLDEGALNARVGTYNYAALDGGPSQAWTEVEADEVTYRRMHKLLWGVERFEDEDA